jgi:hypothetical protein
MDQAMGFPIWPSAAMIDLGTVVRLASSPGSDAARKGDAGALERFGSVHQNRI